MSHQCCCALVDAEGRVDRCGARVASNDQPFCDECERVGHPDAAWQRPQLEREKAPF